MIPRTQLPAALRQLLDFQAGVVSRDQVLNFELSDRVIHRLLRDDTWRPVSSGVYADRPETWLQLAWAGLLIGGRSAVLGLAAAAYLHRFEKEPPAEIAVFTGARQSPARADSRFSFIRADRTGFGDPCRTRPAQTVVDLSAKLGADALAAFLAEVVSRRLVDSREILRILEGQKRHRNRQLLRDILGDVSAGAHSPLEVRYVRDVERAHRLPTAIRQARVGPYRGDALYELYGLLVELDGRAYHQGRASTVDMDRDNFHQLRGVVTLRFGWRQVSGDPCGVARQVAVALKARGWPGTSTPCRHCA